MNKSTKWLPGQPSPNPGGRPRDTRTQALRSMILSEIPAVISQLLVQAKNGDVSASTLLMNKVLPNLKPTAEAITFDIASNDNLATIGQSIVDEIARGGISPDVGAQIITALSNQAKIEEFVTLEQRIAALEGSKS